MQTIRLHDPERRPPNWTDIIRQDQFAAFAKYVDGGGSCDAEGRSFASPMETSCLLFDTFEEARAFCEERVRLVPRISFEIFDGDGRVNPALLVVVGPAHEHRLVGNRRAMRLRKRAAIALTFGALALFWFDYTHGRGILIFPTIVGINMLIVAARLAHMNSSTREVERSREGRLRRAMERAPGGRAGRHDVAGR